MKSWSFFISLNSEEQFDVLIDELEFLRSMFKEIQGERSDRCNVKLKSKEWSEEDGADTFEATIEY